MRETQRNHGKIKTTHGVGCGICYCYFHVDVVVVDDDDDDDDAVIYVDVNVEDEEEEADDNNDDVVHKWLFSLHRWRLYCLAASSGTFHNLPTIWYYIWFCLPSIPLTTHLVSRDESSWWFQRFFIFSPIPGVSWSNLTGIFFKWVGKNHQLVNVFAKAFAWLVQVLFLGTNSPSLATLPSCRDPTEVGWSRDEKKKTSEKNDAGFLRTTAIPSTKMARFQGLKKWAIFF